MFNSMFDELKEAKYCKENTDFKSLIVTSYNVKYCKEIKRLKDLRKAKVYLEGKRGSTKKFFVNILNGLLFLQKNLHHRPPK